MMKQIKNLIMKVFLIFSCSFLLLALPSYACTIFTLTDSKHALFCNNEDVDRTITRIWFVPTTYPSPMERKYGCAYVGVAFPPMWGQGGINTEGLAYDWVAGYKENWDRENNTNLKVLLGNPSERMLESCATVEEAIDFFKEYWEPGFGIAKILISDRSGKSVIIGAKNGILEVNISKHSRGFGYGFSKNPQLLEANPEPTIANASLNLQKAIQQGWTKYSNVFDLKSGNIYIYRFSHQKTPVKLNIVEELKKGAHYYDIPSLKEQLNQMPKSIKLNPKSWIIEADDEN